MSNQMIGQSFLVDPVAPLTAPQPKVLGGGLQEGTSTLQRINEQLDELTLSKIRRLIAQDRAKVDYSDPTVRFETTAAAAVLVAWTRWQHELTTRAALNMRAEEMAVRSPRMIEGE